MHAASDAANGSTTRFRALRRFMLQFVALYLLWLVLSGMYDLFHMGLGVACCAFVAWLTADLAPGETRTLRSPMAMLRLPLYSCWLLVEILKANLRMLYLVFHPRLLEKIDPSMVSFKTRLTSRVSLATLANSITLTPGTITVSIDERGYVIVHAIDAVTAAGVPGEMEWRIAGIFEEKPWTT